VLAICNTRSPRTQREKSEFDTLTRKNKDHRRTSQEIEKSHLDRKGGSAGARGRSRVLALLLLRPSPVSEVSRGEW
jgi:hypothetical protein